jgi:hypothetical protein
MTRRREGGPPWLTWLFVVAGIVATPIALHAASISVLSGPSGLAVVYPFVVIVKSPVLRIPYQLADPTGQCLMYLQYPMYGLLMGTLTRSRGLFVAFGALVFLHGVVGMGLASLLIHFENPLMRFF